MKNFLVRNRKTGQFAHACHVLEGERCMIPHEHYEVRNLHDYDNLELWNCMNFALRFEVLEDK